MRRMQPVAYIRRSARSRSDPGDLSREFQGAKVRELAGNDGATLRVLDGDWGRSAATDKTSMRLDFLALLEEVERGEVSVVYAYATDRLARSVEWAARLLNACRRAGTVIVTSEGRFEPDNAMTDQLFYFQAMQNEGYSRQAQQKRRATVASQRERGDKLGPKYYGDRPGESIEPVLAAFDECGSAHRTAILLNQRGVPTRRGGPWTHSSTRQVLVRAGRVKPYGTQGAKPRAPFVLYRLVWCHCGKVLTGVHHNRLRGKDRTAPLILYRCVNGSTDGQHGVKSISERGLLPFVQAAVDALRPPFDRVEMAARVDVERAELVAEQDRLTILFAKGKIDEETWDRLSAPIDAQLDRVVEDLDVFEVPRIDWTWPPGDINRVLHTLIDHVEVDAALRPVRIHWRGRIAEWAP